MSNLSYLSSLEEVIQASDKDLRHGIGFLSPDTVTEYVFHLRGEVREVRESKSRADEEIQRLQNLVETLQNSLDNTKTALNLHNVPPSAPPLYGELPGPSNSTPTFPNVSGTVWTWAHDGTKPNGIIEFLPDGGTKWFNGNRQGYWKWKNEGSVLETEFNGVYHELQYIPSERKATLLKPARNPPSQMWIQGDRGETPFGFKSLKVALVGHHRKPNKMYVRAHSDGSVDCKDSNFTADVLCDVVQVKPDTVAFRSRFGKYLSAQPSGKLEWNRGGAPNIWEFFRVGKVAEGKITLFSYHGKYVSAQPNGTIEVNRDRALAWEHFEVLDGQHIHVEEECYSPFPNVTGTVWTWAHDGTKPNGIIEFLPDGGTKWFNGNRQGYWKLKNEGSVLETEFNGVYHELKYNARERKAVLKIPERNPASQMWIQGGVIPPGFKSLKVALVGHHRKPNKMYVRAHSDGSVDCKDSNFTADVVCDVVQVKPDTVAFRSRFGKYLSAQPSGKLEWNRGGAPNIWEFFRVV
ncbi:hypothetical protein ACHWQZ_G013358 [Mnemiopsis leidyi]